MSNSFEEKMKESAASFDSYDPPKGHRDRMRQRIRDEKDSVILRITRTQFWSVAAAIALILTTTWWILDQRKTVVDERSELSLSELGTEMAQVETYYLSTISDKKELIVSQTTDEILVQSFFSELERLEAEYKNLEQMLAKYPSNERIIDSMIMNYRKRIEVLESLLNRIETRTDNI